MSNVNHQLPNLLIAENISRSWHSGGKDSILDNPVQLPVAIGLNRLRVQRWHRWCHLIGEGHAGVLTIEAVTDHAVCAKVLLSCTNVVFIRYERVAVGAPAHSDVPLCGLHESGFKFPRCADLAGGKTQQGHRCYRNGKPLLEGERARVLHATRPRWSCSYCRGWRRKSGRRWW
jgi:hypothetical protein